MVEWTNGAIADAIKAYGDARTVVPSSREDWMLAALNAAVQAQGRDFYESIYESVRRCGRAEAFEEAAKILWDRTDDPSDITDKILKGLSGVFRNLAKEGK